MFYEDNATSPEEAMLLAEIHSIREECQNRINELVKKLTAIRATRLPRYIVPEEDMPDVLDYFRGK